MISRVAPVQPCRQTCEVKGVGCDLRELIAAKDTGPGRWVPRNEEEGLPYLAREREALERLSLLTELTEDEHRAFCTSRGLKVRLQLRGDEMKAFCGCDSPSVHIRRSDLGENWPFTTDEGCLECTVPNKEVVFTTVGGRYGVNGIAQSDPQNKPLEGIWAKGEHVPRVNVGGMIQRGLRLCAN